MKRIDLNGKTMVITGASSGVGKATALLFARQGVNLVLAARRDTLLQELASECDSLGANAIAVKTDVTNKESVEYLVEKAISTFGQIDIWFNCAGVGALGEFDGMPIEAHEQIIKTNLFSALYSSYYVLPHFKQRKQGQIINMNSSGAYIGAPFSQAYSISKFGLKGLSESLRAELKGYQNIHICDMFASFIDTTGIHHLANYVGKEVNQPPMSLSPYRVARRILSMARYPRPELHIGSGDLLARIGKFLAPELQGLILNKIERMYFKKAKPVRKTDGNLFRPIYDGNEIQS